MNCKYLSTRTASGQDLHMNHKSENEKWIDESCLNSAENECEAAEHHYEDVNSPSVGGEPFSLALYKPLVITRVPESV